MATNQSFDITCGCDLQEVDNAVNQTNKELTQRYDFRGVEFELRLERTDGKIVLTAPDKHKLEAVWDVLQSKLVRRSVPVRNLKRSDPQTGGGGIFRQDIALQQGIPGDTAKKIVKFIKDKKLKKVQSSIQQDQVRVTSPSRDSLQDVMGLLREEDFDLELSFGNFRST